MSGSGGKGGVMEYASEQSVYFYSVGLEYLDEARDRFNLLCTHLEPWQIVMYTCASTCFFLWCRKMLFSERPLPTRIKQTVFGWLRSLPWVRKQIETEMEKTRRDIEEMIHKCDHRKEFYKFLPEKGLDPEEIIAEAEIYKMMGEFMYLDGKVSGAVYTDENDDHKFLLNAMFDLFAYSNPLHPDVFPGVRKMEAEVIRIVCSLFHGSNDSCGTVTSGGTESILLACLAYRNRAYQQGIRQPEMLIPITAHSAFDKAGDLFRITVRHIPLDAETMQVDVEFMKRAISSETCMLVGSAPNFPYGTVDPIDEISRLGQRYRIPVHVDCCLGGFMLPFMEACDYPVRPFDFRLPGVTSISCDTHKYGYVPKGSSVIMYRGKEFLHHQYYCAPDWVGGIYATPTLAGSRCGANIALTWATLLYYGRHGYIEATQKIVEATLKLRNGLTGMDGIKLIGSSDTSVVAFGSDAFNIYSLADKMNRLGWNLNSLQSPPAVHICMTTNQTKEGVVEDFLDDMRQVSQELLKNPAAASESKTAAIYGMAASVPDKRLVEEVAAMYLDSCYSTPPPAAKDGRTFSVEGRKLSMMMPRPNRKPTLVVRAGAPLGHPAAARNNE